MILDSSKWSFFGRKKTFNNYNSLSISSRAAYLFTSLHVRVSSEKFTWKMLEAFVWSNNMCNFNFLSVTAEKMEVKILAVLWILHLLFQANCRQSGVWFLNQRILIVHCFLAIFNRSCWYKNWTLIRKIVVCHVKIAWCWKHFEMIYWNNWRSIKKFS